MVSITQLRCDHYVGIAVIADMLLTTHFLTLLMVVVWRKNMVFPAMFYIIFGSIEAVFVSSALRKVGWPACLYIPVISEYSGSRLPSLVILAHS